MAKLRSVSTAFWSDPFIEDLTPSNKLLFLYLMTNEKTNMLGIYESSVKKISFETGIKKEDILKGLEEFESLGKVKYENNFIILINYMKHQNFNTNMKKSAIDTYNGLPKNMIINNLNISKDNPSEGFESLLNHYGMVRKVEVKVELEREVEIEYKKEEETNKALPFSFFNSLILLGADKQLASDFIKVRKVKKATNTLTAFNGFKKQLEKSGLNINKVLLECVEKSWGSFKAEWSEQKKEGASKLVYKF